MFSVAKSADFTGQEPPGLHLLLTALQDGLTAGKLSRSAATAMLCRWKIR